MRRYSYLTAVFLFAALALTAGSAPAEDQPVFPVEQLKEGGYVVYFRHAKRDPVPSTARFYQIDSRNSCVSGGSLNPQGRDESRTIKRKMEELALPVGDVYASPTCRTKQMAKMMFGKDFLVTKGLAPAWIKKEKDKNHYYGELISLLKKPVETGKNRFLISHGGVLNEKTINMKLTLQQADAAVFKPQPDSPEGFTFLGIIPYNAWK